MLFRGSSPVSMPYSSSLSDKEWEIFEPLLLQIIPKKKQTRPTAWTKREIVNGILYQLKNGFNWQDLPKEPATLSWCTFAPLLNGVLALYGGEPVWSLRHVYAGEALMQVLHEQVREPVKKSPNGQR